MAQQLPCTEFFPVLPSGSSYKLDKGRYHDSHPWGCYDIQTVMCYVERIARDRLSVGPSTVGPSLLPTYGNTTLGSLLHTEVQRLRPARHMGEVYLRVKWRGMPHWVSKAKWFCSMYGFTLFTSSCLASREPSQLLKPQLKALGSPPTNCFHAPTALWARAVALHSTSQVPVYTSAFPVRLGLYLFIFPPLTQHLSGMNQYLLSVCLPLSQLTTKLRYCSSRSDQSW